VVESVPVTVTKRDGRKEVYDRAKLQRGIELELFHGQTREVKSSRLGDMVLQRLEQLDKVARLRFASVFKDFETPGAFIDELKLFG